MLGHSSTFTASAQYSARPMTHESNSGATGVSPWAPLTMTTLVGPTAVQVPQVGPLWLHCTGRAEVSPPKLPVHACVQALALGADAVMVGRPVLWGLTIDGQEGARRVGACPMPPSGSTVPLCAQLHTVLRCI